MSTENTETVHTNCPEDHTHSHPHPQEEEDNKAGKSEKKVRKALGKLGMTKVENVNRVTIRQKDNYILIVKNPEVFTSQQTENTYIIFGEITFEDSEKKFAKEEIENMRAEGEKLRPQAEEAQKDVEIVDDNEEVSEEGLTEENIQNVMNEAKCTRKAAVKALKACENDVVGAILKLAA
jgi:NACalpha-BTF3-like transcription factor